MLILYNPSRLLTLLCLLAASTSAQVVNPGGGASSPTIQAPALGTGSFYFGNTCPVANTATCFYTPSNTVQFQDANWTNASTTVTFGSAHVFSVGMNVMGGNFCNATSAFSNPGANGQISTGASVTIATVNGSATAQNVSATTITLSATPANSSGAGNSNCFIYGSNDDSGASAVDTALQASSQCPRLFFMTGGYFLKSPHWFTQPTACTNSSPIVSQPAFGNITLPAGFELIGTGPNPTTLFLDPVFPNGNACTNKGGGGQTSGGCFALPPLSKWRDLQINGGPQYSAASMAGKNLFTATVAQFENVTCIDYGNFTSNMTGLNAGAIVLMENFNNAGCGGICINIEGSALNIIGLRVVCEGSGTNALVLGLSTGVAVGYPSFICYWCDFAYPPGISTVNNALILNNGATVSFFGGLMQPAGAFSSNNTGVFLYKDQGGGSLYSDGTYWNMAAAPTGSGAMYCHHAGCVMAFSGSSHINATGANFAYADDTGGALYVDQTFTYSGPFSNGAISGSIVADGHSLLGACTGTANASVTNSLYGTGPNVTSTTCPGQTSTLGAGLVMAQGRTLSALICKSTATTVSVACTIMVNGSASALTCTMTAATECHDFSHTVAVNQGDLISERIVTGAAETGANIKEFVLWQ